MRGSPRYLLGLVLLAALLHLAVSGAEAQQRVAERIKPVFPSITLPLREMSGQAAVTALGADLPAIARWYGKTPLELQTQLLRDPRLRIDLRGRLFVVEELQRPLEATTPTVSQGALDGQLARLDQTFLLHSKRGSTKTIYLNFVGAKITNTAWSSGTLNAVPFDMDGNTAAFSDAELQRIQYMWQRVAEDYAPFDVDVTTEAPADPGILSRSGSTDQVYGTTVVITTRAGVYNCSCGGVAYVGIFNDVSDYYKPALVFYDALGPSDEKYVAEAISHEAGHNMGLSHDGTTTTGYYQGQGTDAVTGWAPIMGVGYYKPLVQFSKGEYANANNKEDDFVVAQSNGLPLRTDDYGSTIPLAAAFPATDTGGLTSGTAEGVVETAADRDVFSISAGAGTLSASAVPAARSPNADLVLTLYNSLGTALATVNPLNDLSATLSYEITQAGTYFIEVKGTGQGTANTTGYSAYGSVGLYKLTASYTTPGAAPPTASFTATPTSGSAPLIVSFDAGASTGSAPLSYAWNFGDTTTSSGSATVQKTYNTAGTYTAQLRVTDSAGVSSTASRTITVAAAQNTLSVSKIAMAIRVSRTGARNATATVTVVNQKGQAVSSASVTGSWSGLVSGTATATTNKNGQVTFTSPTTRVTGCYRLTVTSVRLSGYTYSPATAPYNEICG